MNESTNSFKSVEFTWTIANYSQQKLTSGPGKGISSQDFTVGREGDMKFTLDFYPHGDLTSSDNKVSNGEKWASLSLYTEGSKKYHTSHLTEFSILDKNGKKFSSRHFHKKIPFELGFGFKEFIRVTDLENPAKNLLPNDTLTICCRVEETKSKSEICNCRMEKPETKRAGRNLGQDLADKYADFVFKVGNVKIAAHRVILAARSPVFDTMFQCDMQEKKTNQTKIKDMTPSVFRALLRFIYTGHCQVGNLAEQLLIAADKYDIQDLKEICAKELRKNLAANNAVDLLILSDLHQTNDLKEGAIRFINKNAPAVMKTPSWPDFRKNHPNLIFELYSKLLGSK